ncbi:hypothetical protein CNMCM7691_002504 [Aspergillus felis]|uniref:Uncharacterized protein n=1 Tax=Aspergillus felis TaxID=1287682 RepID=A0A8H6V750_9EURO|nr:hypothetical protein CNMCM7691_002504 [Aspergillus felis]
MKPTTSEPEYDATSYHLPNPSNAFTCGLMPVEQDAWPAEADASVPRIGLGILIICCQAVRGTAIRDSEAVHVLGAKGATASYSHLHSGSGMGCLGGMGFSIWSYIAILWNEVAQLYEIRYRSYSITCFFPAKAYKGRMRGRLDGFLGGISSNEGFGPMKLFLLDTCAVTSSIASLDTLCLIPAPDYGPHLHGPRVNTSAAK